MNVRMLLTLGLLAVALPVMISGAVRQAADPAYRAEMEKWRQDREARLKADDGWLTVAGLFWLNEGDNRFGTDPLNDIVLPEGSAPAEVGVFRFHAGQTTVHVNEGVTVTMGGKLIRSAELRPDVPGPADVIAIGSLTLFVHASGERLGVRLKDKNSRLLREFTGLKWFPVDESYRVKARFVPYEAPKKVQVPNILGDIEQFTSPGIVVFALEGRQFRMEPVSSGRRLWFIFRDLTSGKETYPAARFLYADGTPDGKEGDVVVDFNQAYNPPCAFNPYTTCPLPPEQNRLRIRIEAGEMTYGHDAPPSDQKPE